MVAKAKHQRKKRSNKWQNRKASKKYKNYVRKTSAQINGCVRFLMMLRDYGAGNLYINTAVEVMPEVEESHNHGNNSPPVSTKTSHSHASVWEYIQ
jgi:hypothetical protein